MSVARPRLSSCSRLAVLAAICIACLAFSGVAQAAAPPDPNTVGSTTLSHIELNGVLATELTVAPGQDVRIKANWADHNPCSACLDQVPTAFAGNAFAGCIENGVNGREGPGESGSGEVDLRPAPKAPGTYNVVAQFEEQFHCGAAWNASASSGYPVIARVIVPGPPTSKQQCKKGGWKKLVDSNGKPFKNQGQCVKFVKANSPPEGAQKRPLYGPLPNGELCNTGGAATPQTFGFAILDTPGNETTLSGVVSLKGAVPNTTYTVLDSQASPLPSCAKGSVGTITTDNKGNGNLEFTTAREPHATTFFVVVEREFAVMEFEEFASPAVKLD